MEIVMEKRFVIVELNKATRKKITDETMFLVTPITTPNDSVMQWGWMREPSDYLDIYNSGLCMAVEAVDENLFLDFKRWKAVCNVNDEGSPLGFFIESV